jgi:hypothetical protein
VSTGITIPAGAEVIVTVSGFLHYSPNPGRLQCSSQPPGPPPGGLTEVGPVGFPQELYPGWIYTGHGVLASIQTGDYDPWAEAVVLRPRDPSAETVSGQLTAPTTGPGVLWVNRRPGFPGSCWSPETAYQPDYFVSGQQTLTVEVVDRSIGIEVDCTGSGAPRGSTISCQARPQPSTEILAVTRWTFISTASDTVVRQTNISDQTWAGQLVVDGRVDVTGTVAGHPAAGSTSVTISARDWSTKTVRSNHTTPGADGLPIHPWADSLLGRSDLGTRLRGDVDNYASVITDGGPNSGFTYMTDIPYETFTVARVNYPAMTQGSDWYLLQYPKDRKVRGVGYCGQPRVLTLPPLVEAHEGTDPANQPNSHVGIYINDVNRDSRVLAETIAGLNPNPEPIRAQLHNAAYADSKAMDTDSRNNMRLPCVFRYFPP